MSKYFDESGQQSDEFEPVVPPGLCACCYAPTTGFDEELCVDCITEFSDYVNRFVDKTSHKDPDPFYDLKF